MAVQLNFDAASRMLELKNPQVNDHIQNCSNCKRDSLTHFTNFEEQELETLKALIQAMFIKKVYDKTGSMLVAELLPAIKQTASDYCKEYSYKQLMGFDKMAECASNNPEFLSKMFAKL